jgi:ATP-dependent Clp endopeptidase proteolytic subunit ClpP
MYWSSSFYGFIFACSWNKRKKIFTSKFKSDGSSTIAGFQGQVTDIEIHANEVSSLKKRLNEIYSKHTGKSVDEVKAALERDNFMTAEVAKDFGLIDEVVEKRS